MRLAIYGVMILWAVIPAGRAENPEIISFDDGHAVTWTSSMTTGVYDVQWAATPTGVWHNTWDHLLDIPATEGELSVEVPRFFRILHREAANTNTTAVASELAATFTSGTTALSGILNNGHVVPNTVVLYARSNQGELLASFSDAGNGVLFGADGAVGTMAYQAGAWSIQLPVAPIMSDGQLHASYSYYNANP